MDWVYIKLEDRTEVHNLDMIRKITVNANQITFFYSAKETYDYGLPDSGASNKVKNKDAFDRFKRQLRKCIGLTV